MNIYSKLSIVFAIVALAAGTGCAAQADGEEVDTSGPAVVPSDDRAPAAAVDPSGAARKDDMPIEVNGPMPTPGDPAARDLPRGIGPSSPCPSPLPEIAR